MLIESKFSLYDVTHRYLNKKLVWFADRYFCLIRVIVQRTTDWPTDWLVDFNSETAECYPTDMLTVMAEILTITVIAESETARLAHWN